MAKEQAAKFIQELAGSEELQNKLNKAQESYIGDTGNWDSLLQELVLLVAREAGYDFTIEEFHAFEREELVRRNLSEEELENVSGGGTCIILGMGKKASACFGSGVARGSKHAEGVHACALLGAGIGGW